MLSIQQMKTVIIFLIRQRLRSGTLSEVLFLHYS